MHYIISLHKGGNDLVMLVKQSIENQKRLETLVTTGFRDLKKMIEENERRCFSLKDSGYEVTIRTSTYAMTS